jgi:hypothetical protein
MQQCYIQIIIPHKVIKQAHAGQLNSLTQLRALLVLTDRGILAHTFWPTQQAASQGSIPPTEVTGTMARVLFLCGYYYDYDYYDYYDYMII